MSPARLGSNRDVRFDGDCTNAGDDDEVHAPPPPRRNEDERRVLAEYSAEAGGLGRLDSCWMRWTRLTVVHLCIRLLGARLSVNFMLPKRRFGKAKQTFGNAFSKHF